VHETVHAWDDKENWYLSWSYLYHLRQAEALGYGAEYILEEYSDLVTMRDNRKDMSPADFDNGG